MTDFTTLISNYSNLAQGHALTTIQIAELLAEGSVANGVHPSNWASLRRILTDHTSLKAKEISDKVRRARVSADLTRFPHTADEFVEAFLDSRAYRMGFDGQFNNGATDADRIRREMVIWNSETGGKMFDPDVLKAAFQNWQEDEMDRLLKRASARLRYDPQADGTELERFVAYIVKPQETPEATAQLQRATVVALQNFIFRVKNHLRKKWFNGAHLMPVFMSPGQGSGKTVLVSHFLSPLGSDMAPSCGFDILGHDAKSFKLSVNPVVFFDEMAAIGKADVETLKEVMTAEVRSFRQLYGNPVSRRVMATFIACSNRDVSEVVRDETGNRRFLQVDVQVPLDRKTIMAFDALAIWRSVDEDAVEPPMYARESDLDAIKTIQVSQKHMSPLEHWLGETPDLDTYASSSLFADHFKPWVEIMYPHDRTQNLNRFGRELNRLFADGHPRLECRHGKTTKLWSIVGHAPSYLRAVGE